MKSNPLLLKVSFLIACLTIIFSIYNLGFNVQQSAFKELIAYYTPCFLAYILFFFFVKKENTIWYLVGLGIFLRFLLLFSFPNLSDDIYRFIWDGNLAINGINPFNHLPSYFIDNQLHIPGITKELFDELNSPNYYTIYPPVCQGIFATACWIFPESWIGSAIIMKSFMFAFECGSVFLIIKLLRHFEMPFKNVLLYALNPLVIIEITGNLHFEGAMVFFLLLSIWFLIKSLFKLSAIAIAFSIASKLLPLIFLPFLIRRLGWKKSFQYFTIVGVTLITLFSPLLNELFIHNFGKSLDLYFQKFEFNASIYYLLRWFFRLITGYNQIATIGPLMGLCVLSGVIIYTFKEDKLTFESLFKAMLFGICLYLFLATTIHPWYVILPLTFSIFTSFRFPVIWSGLIFLTYINYSYPSYFENLWVVGIEYSIVFGFMIWEFSKLKKGNIVAD